MRTTLKTMTAALGIVLIGTMLAATATAECGNQLSVKPGASLRPQSWQGQSGFESGSLRLVADLFSGDPIVGMWKVAFIAKGNPPPLPPDGVVIDNAFVQWHSDGTEIMNSSRNPATQSFCLGVWQRVGLLHYRLNHFAISWDPATDPNNPQGPANIREEVLLSPTGLTFIGTFTIDQYDQSGHLLVHLTGQLRAKRITVNTPASSLFQGTSSTETLARSSDRVVGRRVRRSARLGFSDFN